LRGCRISEHIISQSQSAIVYQLLFSQQVEVVSVLLRLEALLVISLHP
jgi:hypothetical protein